MKVRFAESGRLCKRWLWKEGELDGVGERGGRVDSLENRLFPVFLHTVRPALSDLLNGLVRVPEGEDEVESASYFLTDASAYVL